jgi:hypothetical protein
MLHNIVALSDPKGSEKLVTFAHQAEEREAHCCTRNKYLRTCQHTPTNKHLQVSAIYRRMHDAAAEQKVRNTTNFQHNSFKDDLARLQHLMSRQSTLRLAPCVP